MSMDFVARALASQAGRGGNPLAARRSAFRIFGGRVAGVQPVSPTNLTFETVMALACPAEAIRIVYAFGQTAAGDALPVEVTSLAGTIAENTDAAIQSADSGKKLARFDGEIVLQASPSLNANRRQFYRSDWIALPSRERTDGGEGSLYVVRTTLKSPAQSGNAVLLGNGSDSIANWATHPSGRIFQSRSKPSVSAGNWTGFTRGNSDPSDFSPVVGIEYLARGQVVSVAGFGDSITEGRSTYKGEGFGLPACVALTNRGSGIAFEWSNLAWSGQASSQIYEQVEDCAAFGLVPGVATLPVFTPNGFASSPSQAAIDAMQLFFALSLARLEEAGTEIIQWTGLPISSSVYDIGSADEMRRTANRLSSEATARGMTVCDFAKRFEAGIDADGQSNPGAGLLADGIHPSDAGNAVMSAILSRAIEARVKLPRGLLAA